MATNGIVLLTPSSVNVTGGGSETATINTNGSVTFSACTTLSLNDVFSSTYDNYIIDCRNATFTAAAIQFRLRLSGTDNSAASSYVTQYWFAASTSVTAARITETFGYIGARGNTQKAGFTATIYGPALAQPTAYRSVLADDSSSATVTDYAATHNVSTAYDGFTMFVGSNTIDGLIKVYGLVQ